MRDLGRDFRTWVADCSRNACTYVHNSKHTDLPQAARSCCTLARCALFVCVSPEMARCVYDYVPRFVEKLDLT